MKLTHALLAAFALFMNFSLTVIAADGTAQSAKETQSSSTAVASLTAGEVRKVDKDAGKITIKHEPLTNLGMPAMTMVFRVKEPGMLDQVKVGDKIHFVAEKVDGQFTVTKMEAKE